MVKRTVIWIKNQNIILDSILFSIAFYAIAQTKKKMFGVLDYMYSN